MIAKKNEYSIQGNKAVIGNSELVFDFPIADSLEIEGMLIVLLSIPVDVQYNENVFGVSIVDKKVKWQISKKQYIPAYKQQCPFVSIVSYEGKLRLNNWCSVYFIVDPLTGKILKEGDAR
jgi:hypothetical protein